MRQHVINSVLFGLHLTAFALLATILVALLLSFKASKNFNDVWQQLGLSEQAAGTRVKESFIYGYLQYAGVSKARHIAVGDREAVSKDMLAFSKVYVKGAEFKKAYDQLREGKKPTAPEKARTEAEIRKKNIESIKEGIANVEKGMKEGNAEMKKMLQETLTMFQNQLKAEEDPKNPMTKMLAEAEQQSFEYNTKKYNEDLKKWEKEYPADPAPFVKSRLVQMLNETKGIDYNAELVERNGKKYFVNKVYEGKNSNWKMGFRAGKEVTETARTYVQQWISEL